ncbi:hypothetical protein LOC68_02465 [Blastopirellula sp. JC732]|uniref:Uncharacterized protein n=1 Tax=Blastopirellula sediminis TaxID=2894196 RepID=A0A9X1MJ55_9BACT|nr:hypothetical protein [Blastopirellula sediminis]MCC9607947.1 hypothetical protein [Blastopirellula sediminis]MCC9627260.1 hypothetical protein [Blastopirellula sediminis]
MDSSEESPTVGLPQSRYVYAVLSVVAAVVILGILMIVLRQIVPANPVFYMRNVKPAWARFNAPKSAVYLIVQGLPDRTILAEWSDNPKNFNAWLAEQAKRPGVTDFQQQKVVEPIDYPYPNSLLTWGSSATAEKGQRATWQEGDRTYEVLWDDEFGKEFGEMLINYVERNAPVGVADDTSSAAELPESE